MASNFWLSSHCNRWMCSSKKEIDRSNPHDRDALSNEELRQLRLYFVDFLTTLGTSKRLNLRQRIIATSIIYFKRFYLEQSFIEFDPLLTAPTMLFLAAKVEECGVHANVMMSAALDLDPSFPYTTKHLFECEFFALELLRFDLIVYHPYRPITLYIAQIGLTDSLPTAWAIANDSLCTDVALLYPPYVIAIACIRMAAMFHDHSDEVRVWFQKLRLKYDQVFEVMAEILQYYDYRTKHSSAPDDVLAKLKSHTVYGKTSNNTDSSLVAELIKKKALAPHQPLSLSTTTTSTTQVPHQLTTSYVEQNTVTGSQGKSLTASASLTQHITTHKAFNEQTQADKSSSSVHMQ